MSRPLDSQTKQEIAARIRYYRELGIYDFYRRDVRRGRAAAAASPEAEVTAAEPAEAAPVNAPPEQLSILEAAAGPPPEPGPKWSGAKAPPRTPPARVKKPWRTLATPGGWRGGEGTRRAGLRGLFLGVGLEAGRRGDVRGLRGDDLPAGLPPGRPAGP